MSLNKVELSGNLCRDPELRYVGASSTAVTTLVLAVNEKPYKNKAGEEVKNTYFFDVEVWGKQAEEVSTNFKKGSRVEISGLLTQQKWVGKEGENRSKVVVKALKVTKPEKSAPPTVAAGTGAGVDGDVPF